jgi:Ser/Thr protein kinase RdoA (MazF antagonist)
MMVVELAGPPGAGKTTLLPAVLRACAGAGLQPYTVEQAAREFGRRTAIGRLACVLPGDARGRALWALYLLLSGFGAVRFLLAHPALARYVVANQRRRPAAADARQRRTVYWYFRTAGSYAFVRAHGRPNEVVVVDEGFVHRTVQLHASSVERPDPAQIRRYVELLPPVDLLIVVHAPEALCRRRVLERGVWSRLAHRQPDEIELFVSNAHRALELAAEAVRGSGLPLVEVENAGDLDPARAELHHAVEDLLCGPEADRATRIPRPRVCVPRARHLANGLASARRAPAIDPGTCAAILDRYRLAVTRGPHNIPSGRRNRSVVLHTTVGKVVLRRHRETAPLTTVRHEHAVLRELERRRFPAVRLIATPEGETVVPLGAHTYALFAFEEGVNLASCRLTRRDGPRVLEAAGRTLAGMHGVLEAFFPEELHHLEHASADREVDHTLEWHLKELAGLPELPIPGDGRSPREAELLNGQREWITERLIDLHRMLEQAALPTTVIHGDYGVHNILLRRDGTLVLHDLELARRAWRLVDLVIVLSRLSGNGARAFIGGYDSQAHLPGSELLHLAEVWEYYHLTGAIRSWSNYTRCGGAQRLVTASQRLSRAQRAPGEALAPWR